MRTLRTDWNTQAPDKGLLCPWQMVKSEHHVEAPSTGVCLTSPRGNLLWQKRSSGELCSLLAYNSARRWWVLWTPRAVNFDAFCLAVAHRLGVTPLIGKTIKKVCLLWTCACVHIWGTGHWQHNLKRSLNAAAHNASTAPQWAVRLRPPPSRCNPPHYRSVCVCRH